MTITLPGSFPSNRFTSTAAPALPPLLFLSCSHIGSAQGAWRTGSPLSLNIRLAKEPPDVRAPSLDGEMVSSLPVALEHSAQLGVPYRLPAVPRVPAYFFTADSSLRELP